MPPVSGEKIHFLTTMKKLYYSIGEVSEITAIEPHVLRYWETIFKELQPRKNKAGNRTYKEDDIATVLRLKELIQQKGYSTSGAKKALEDEAAGTSGTATLTAEARRDLKEIRLFLSKLQVKI